MGRKIKRRIDWSLDKGNDAGDVVMLAQHAQTSLGVVSFLGQAPTYSYHARIAEEAYQKARELQEKVLELPVSEDNNVRYLFDNSLLEEVYITGSQMTINAYLMLEHIVLHVGITLFRQKYPEKFTHFEKKELQDKLKAVLEGLQLEELVKSKGYGVLFSDIERVRHAIHHPKGDNIYSTDACKWDHIPIAWFVSGRHLLAYGNVAELYSQVLDGWNKYMESNKTPGTITLDGPIMFEGYSAVKKPRN